MTMAHFIGIVMALTLGLIMLKLGIDFSQAIQNLGEQLNSQK